MKLREHEILLFPTDTVLGIGCLLSRECINRLREITERPENKPFAMLLSDISDIENWIKEIPEIFEKLKKYIPGPLTLIFKGLDSLPEGVLSSRETVGIRIPDSDDLRDLIRNSELPLVATSANVSGSPTPDNTEDVDIDYDRVIEGISISKIPSTILDITKKKPVLLRRGVISIYELEKACEKEILLGKDVDIHILFVCSANMCRSPMAEAHLKSLTDKMDPVEVRSAGTIAINGTPISMGARKVLEENNLDSRHHSVRIAVPILKWADIIFVTEKEHIEQITDMHPKSREKTVLLSDFKSETKGKEIEDPIGKDIEVYYKVFDEIKEANRRILSYLTRKIKSKRD